MGTRGNHNLFTVKLGDSPSFAWDLSGVYPVRCLRLATPFRLSDNFG